MKATGIVRRVDDLGRIVLPIELRRSLCISERDALEIYLDADSIVLRKRETGEQCVFCGKSEELEERMGKYICRDCLEALKA